MTTSDSLKVTPSPDAEDDGPIPFQTWLLVSTKRLQRTDEERAKALENAEISKETWQSAERYWNLAIASGIAAGDPSLSDQLAAACVRELRERRAASAPVDPKATSAPSVPGAVPKTHAPPLERTPPLDSRPPAAQAPAALTPPPQTADSANKLAPPAMVPRMASEGGSLKPSFLLHREAVSAVVSEPPVFAESKSTTAPAQSLQGTLDLGTMLGAIPGATPLPFRSDGDAEESAVTRAKQHAAETQGKNPAPAPVGGTEAVDVSALVRKVLAFGLPKQAVSHVTVTPPGASVDPGAKPALPTLTVEQYASLCVDVELAPQGVTEALRRYGVTPDARRALDEAWSRMFAEQPDRKGAFEHAKTTYRAWLSRGGR